MVPFCVSVGWQLAKALRKGPFQTQILMAGVDKRAGSNDEASLFWMDYLGTLQKVRYGLRSVFFFGPIHRLDPQTYLRESFSLSFPCSGSSADHQEHFFFGVLKFALFFFLVLLVTLGNIA